VIKFTVYRENIRYPMHITYIEKQKMIRKIVTYTFFAYNECFSQKEEKCAIFPPERMAEEGSPVFPVLAGNAISFDRNGVH
jgi:hypothetical protein